MTPAIGPFFLLRPSHSDRRALERRIPSLQFNFPHVGITTNTKELNFQDLQDLKGWAINRTRAQVGTGREAYNKAVAALLTWRHFYFDWAFTNAPTIKRNASVVVIAQSLFLWSMNPLRITSVEKNIHRKVKNKSGTGVRQQQRKCYQTSFAHTTVAGHQISGEERFTVEWNKENDSVWYEVYTISKPATLVATLAQPLLRFYQRLFVVQSIQAMKKRSFCYEFFLEK
ncbi:hypothetical protein Ndes2437A_g03375 [Nannochloris sp. 'desiccata']